MACEGESSAVNGVWAYARSDPSGRVCVMHIAGTSVRRRSGRLGPACVLSRAAALGCVASIERAAFSDVMETRGLSVNCDLCRYEADRREGRYESEEQMRGRSEYRLVVGWVSYLGKSR